MAQAQTFVQLTTVTPVYRTGTGVPSNALGNNGDVYVNTANGDFYGPKAAGVWPASTLNLKGATGSTGATGYAPQYIVAAGVPSSGTGNNGDMYVNSTTEDVYGPKAGGAWGAIVTNIKGATGSNASPVNWRGAYAGGTTYAQGDGVSDVSINYVSLQAANTGHTPASSPTFWQSLGATGLNDPGSNGLVKRTAVNTTAVAVPNTDYLTPTWTANVNAGNNNLNNLSGVGIGTATPGAVLQVQSTGADSHVYVSDTAPRIGMGNNATYASRTQSTRWVMATANGNFGLPTAGDTWIFTEGIGAGVAGDLYLGANSSLSQVCLKKNGNIFLRATTYTSDSDAGTTGGLTAGMIWKDSSGNLHSKL